MAHVSNMRPQSRMKGGMEENSSELQQGLRGDQRQIGSRKQSQKASRLYSIWKRLLDPIDLNNRVHVQVFSNVIASCSARLRIQPNTELFDLRGCHWRSVLPDHLSKVLRERIDLLLEKENGGSKGTQLPFINNKGEFVHLIIRASKDKLQGHHSLRQKQGESSGC
jgi:hypothetical protein